MRKDGFMKSGLYRVLDYIARLVILNVLILIISFLLLLIFKDQKWPLIITALTFLPSIVSAFKVIKDYEDGKNPSIFKPFFKAFKQYYIKRELIMSDDDKLYEKAEKIVDEKLGFYYHLYSYITVNIILAIINLIFSPNEIFSNYISDVLPSLGERNILQTEFSKFIKTKFYIIIMKYIKIV